MSVLGVHWVCWFHFCGFCQTKLNQWLEIPNFWHFMSQIGWYWPLKWPSLVFSKNVHFGCYIGFIGPFKTHFTLAQFWFWAFFLDFFSKKPTSEAHSTNFIFGAFKERSIMVYFEKKIFKRRADQKLRCPNFHFWNAHISLVNALIFTCSNPLRPCCQ